MTATKLRSHSLDAPTSPMTQKYHLGPDRTTKQWKCREAQCWRQNRADIVEYEEANESSMKKRTNRATPRPREEEEDDMTTSPPIDSAR